MNIELLGWIATVILLAGYWANARKKIYSWIIWMIGNTLMLVYAFFISSDSVAFLSIVLIGMNIYGYFSWKNQ
jgi:nicotinamide riboside transporter PnuC